VVVARGRRGGRPKVYDQGRIDRVHHAARQD
jgi:hypothetical protein